MLSLNVFVVILGAVAVLGAVIAVSVHRLKGAMALNTARRELRNAAEETTRWKIQAATLGDVVTRQFTAMETMRASLGTKAAEHRGHAAGVNEARRWLTEELGKRQQAARLAKLAAPAAAPKPAAQPPRQQPRVTLPVQVPVQGRPVLVQAAGESNKAFKRRRHAAYNGAA
jgi:hypothetical protein